MESDVTIQKVPVMVYIMCPIDGGELELDKGLSRRDPTMVCMRCGNRYPYTPDLQRRGQHRDMLRRLGA